MNKSFPLLGEGQFPTKANLLFFLNVPGRVAPRRGLEPLFPT